MNSIDKNYISKLNIKETQEANMLIEDFLSKSLIDNLELIKIRPPIISSKRVITNISSLNGERQINFDGSNDNNIYFIYNNYRYWLVQTLENLEIANNNAIMIFANYIERDSEISNTKSMEKKVIEIEYRYDNKEKAFEKADEIKDILLKIFKNLQNKISYRFPKLKTIFTENIVEKNLNIIPAKNNLEQALADIGATERIFILTNKKNDKIKTSLFNSFEITLQAYSKEIDESYQIFKIQDRRTMEDIEPYTSNSEIIMEEYLFGKEILKNNIRSLNIEINLDSLAMLLLNKSHILELQSGKNITDIENILSLSDIKHL